MSYHDKRSDELNALAASILEPKPTRPEVPAPDSLEQVWVIYRKRAAGPSIDVAETVEMADALCNYRLGDYVVRYVRGREGGR